MRAGTITSETRTPPLGLVGDPPVGFLARQRDLDHADLIFD
ncbi:MAG TPA: hypothetical protein PKD58_11570 [Candidatus Sumerlaeota bacterium]|nr:hypothetical protein [Candidatus Sumerlaeota bacterium]